MFTYTCLGTNDIARAIPFYDATLGALGHSRCYTPDESDKEYLLGWGRYENDGSMEMALWVGKPFDGQPASSGNGVMIALRANTWAEVEQFHALALRHGGTSEGAPGLRPHYGADFYAGYVRDPDGNKLAAVCRGFTHAPETPAP